MSSKSAELNFLQFKQEGDKALEQKDFAKALELYQQALAINADDAELYKALGRVYHDQNEYQIAETYYLTAIDKDQNYWAPYHNLGNIYKGLNDFDKAQQYYQKAIALNPSQISSYASLGLALGNLKQYILAQHYFQEAYAREPDNYLIFFNHAAMLLNKGDYEQAVILLERLLNLIPEEHLLDVYLKLAHAYHKLPNHREKAIKYYQSYASLCTVASYKHWAYCNLVRLYYELAQYEQALESCQLAVDCVSNELDEFGWLNEFTRQCNYKQEATPLLELGIKFLLAYVLAHPTSAFACFFLALCFNSGGQYFKAIKYAKIAIEIDPSHPRAYYQLAQAYYYTDSDGNGQMQECIKILKKMIEIDPLDYYGAYEMLALAYREQGKKRSACIAEKKAEQLKNYRTTVQDNRNTPRLGEIR